MTESTQKLPRSVVIFTILFTEIAYYVITVIGMGVAFYVLTGKILILPAFLAGSIMDLVNFVRYRTWEIYGKRLTEAVS